MDNNGNSDGKMSTVKVEKKRRLSSDEGGITGLVRHSVVGEDYSWDEETDSLVGILRKLQHNLVIDKAKNQTKNKEGDDAGNLAACGRVVDGLSRDAEIVQTKDQLREIKAMEKFLTSRIHAMCSELKNRKENRLDSLFDSMSPLLSLRETGILKNHVIPFLDEEGLYALEEAADTVFENDDGLEHWKRLKARRPGSVGESGSCDVVWSGRDYGEALLCVRNIEERIATGADLPSSCFFVHGRRKMFVRMTLRHDNGDNPHLLWQGFLQSCETNRYGRKENEKKEEIMCLPDAVKAMDWPNVIGDFPTWPAAYDDRTYSNRLKHVFKNVRITVTSGRGGGAGQTYVITSGDFHRVEDWSGWAYFRPYGGAAVNFLQNPRKRHNHAGCHFCVRVRVEKDDGTLKLSLCYSRQEQ